nr:integrase, catalytic region, zinc finger, CCHC-type, peptidase aspartic, catalytic [Tanacetum cinerariifolium]
MQTQTSNTLHNAIMEAGSKDRPPMLAPGNYVQWKSRIKRYIDTKSNHELIHYCLTNPPYELGWIDKEIPISEGSPITRTKRIDNDIYLTVDACPNACEMWKAIESLKQEWQRFVTLVKQSQELKTVSYHKLYDILKQHQHEVNEIRAKRIARVANPLALVAQQQPVYHPQTHPTHYTQNSSTRSQQAAIRNRGKAIINSPQPIYDQEPFMVVEDDETANQDNSPRINKNAGYENQRTGNVDGARETVGSTMVQKSEIQCYNCMEFGHVARECQKPKRAKDAAYHREKMLLCNEHPEQSESVHDTYPIDQDAHNVIIDSLDMSYDREEIDQNDDDDNDLAIERELLASLIEKLKCEIDENKNHNKFLETSNKVLIEQLKGEIEDFKNKNKSLESSNNHFKEVNNKLAESHNLLYTDYKKSEAELARRNSREYASQMEIKCAKLVEIVLFIIDSGCSKHMRGNLKLLINFVEKFLGTIKFGNDQIVPILRYGDLVQGAVMIKRVYYVEELNHNLFSVGQFCDANLEVAFRKSTCYIRDSKGNDLLTDETPEVLIDFLRLVQRGLQAQVRIVRTDKETKFLNQNLQEYFAAEGIHHQTFVARTPEQNGVVEIRHCTIVEAARTMLSAAKVLLFFWAEAIATACFT